MWRVAARRRDKPLVNAASGEENVAPSTVSSTHGKARGVRCRIERRIALERARNSR